MAQTTGTSWIKVNGDFMRTRPGSVDFNPGGWERSSTPADNQAHVGFSKKPVGSSLSASLVHMADTDLRAMADLEDAVVEVETDTGTIYVIEGASVSEPPVLSGDDGEVSIGFIGPPATEQ